LRQHVQSFDKQWARLLEFFFPGLNQLPQQGLAFRRNPDEDKTAVAVTSFPVNEAPLLKPIDKFDRTVMPQAEPFGQVADCRLESFRQSLHDQKEPVLSRMKTGVPCGLITKSEIPVEVVPKFGQCAVIRQGDVSCGSGFGHINVPDQCTGRILV
jgi:hypothetical protein